MRSPSWSPSTVSTAPSDGNGTSRSSLPWRSYVAIRAVARWRRRTATRSRVRSKLSMTSLPSGMTVSHRQAACRDRSRHGKDVGLQAARYPGDGAPVRVRDAVRKLLPRRRLDDGQRRHLVAATRESVGDVPRVVGGVVPVERGQARRIERVRINESAIRRADRVADVEDGLLLLPLPARVEDAAADRPGRGEQPDPEKLPQATRDTRTLWQRVKDRAGALVLLVGPVANAFGRVRLEPAIRIGDLHAVHVIDDGVACGTRRRWKRHVF